jgi:prepilin-type N-terminal cleavage/methylation domain-containing protein
LCLRLSHAGEPAIKPLCDWKVAIPATPVKPKRRASSPRKMRGSARRTRIGAPRIPLENDAACALLNIAAMKPSRSNQSRRALTLVELLVVIVVLAVLAAMLLPDANSGSHRKAVRHENSLRQQSQTNRSFLPALGWRQRRQIPDGMYPSPTAARWGWPTAGTLGSTFFVMSNQLSTPKLLHCPADM